MIWIIVLCVVAVLYFSHRYAWWRPAVDYRKPRVLMYHMICESQRGQKFRGLRVSPRRFEQQLQWLTNHGWQFVTVSELLAMEEPKEKLVALTFDDGFEDNLTNALPIMKRYGAKGTLYLVVDRHDRDWSTAKKAHHNSGELQREPKLSDEQVRELLASGLFELGSHTDTHINMVRTERFDKERELQNSKQQLEQDFGVPVNSFAYPFGLYESTDPELAKAAGYTTAVTTDTGIDSLPFSSPLQLKRIKISGKDNLLAFILRMRSGYRGLNK